LHPGVFILNFNPELLEDLFIEHNKIAPDSIFFHQKGVQFIDLHFLFHEVLTGANEADF
jgi:hypothetical protein